VKPFAVSIVDTYGLLHQDNLVHYFDLLNNNLDPEIGLGYHAHNNFQMAYANCIAVLEKAISGQAKREMVVDGTIYGMGKSAGNAPLELIAMHMNNSFGTKYQVGQILEAIDTSVSEFYQTPTWGYSIFYFIAAFNDCHPNYVSYLMDKRTLSITSINEILGSLQGEKKLLYDKNYIEALYVDYEKNEINDEEDRLALGKALRGKNILVLGPGATMESDAVKKKIIRYVEEEHPTVISINYIPKSLRPDYVFLSNSKRYLQLASKLSRTSQTIIATSNLTETTTGAFAYRLNYGSLIDLNTDIIDNSLVMLLKALIGIGVDNVKLAGFDGYSLRASNYVQANMEYDFIRKKVSYLNTYVTEFLESVKDQITVEFLTKSHYEE
jgi:4-hydroxy 2-oxovalerate aldolase